MTYFSAGNFAGCRFENNVTQNKGGGLSTTGVSNVKLAGTTFAGNRAEADGPVARGGGAMFIRESRADILPDCEFEGNFAKKEGGAIWAGTEELDISWYAELFLEREVRLHIKDKVKFTQNKAETGFGGAVAVSGVLGGNMRHLFIGPGAPNTVTFERNEVLDTADTSKGGAVALYDANGKIDVTDCNFVKNCPTALQISIDSNNQLTQYYLGNCRFDGQASVNEGAHHAVCLKNVRPHVSSQMNKLRVQRHRTGGILLVGSDVTIFFSLFRANGPEHADITCADYSRAKVISSALDGVYPYPAQGAPSKYGVKVIEGTTEDRVNVGRSNISGYWIGAAQYGVFFDMAGPQGLVVSSRNNWWGHTKGPHDPSDDTATGGLYNDNDMGSQVSDGVDYKFWKEHHAFNIPIKW
jgi:predicted outer membrane repeat protein